MRLMIPVLLLPLMISAHGGKVIRNAEIARQRMRDIWLAYNIYCNDYGSPPPALSALYSDWIADPETF